MQDVQQTATSIIAKVLGGKNLNQVLDEEFLANQGLTSQQRGAIQDISYGVLRHYGSLQAMLTKLLARPLHDRQIHNLLLTALYQLQYSKAAPYAIVDHAVRTARKLKPATAGLVNAVLRNYLRDPARLMGEANETDLGRYSYPEWWIDVVRRQYPEQFASVLLAGNQHPPMTLRVNQRKVTASQYLDELKQQEIDAKSLGGNAIKLVQPVPVGRLPGFFEGRVSVQDAGAQYAAQLLDPRTGMRVLDACAAPGGKTAHLLEIADIELVAIDKDAERLKRIHENLSRLGLTAQVRVGDASHPEAWWDGKQFDLILADVPCTASGVVRRHPDIKWLRRPQDIANFAQQQRQILLALWPLLHAGGKLLYATCSIFAEENQQNVTAFLHATPDAIQVDLPVGEMNGGQLLPNEQHDGFFYALLQKQA